MLIAATKKKREVNLQKAAVAKIGLDDNVADSCHDKLDLTRVCCTCEVGIDLFRL